MRRILKKIIKTLLNKMAGDLKWQSFFENIIETLFNKMAGDLKWQSFFENIYHMALHGMHIGDGYGCETSGEIYCVKYISKKYQNKPLVVFDVGANIGNYTIMVNNELKDMVQIYSFEPSKATYQKMVENTATIQNIQRNNFGLGNCNTTMTLYSDAVGSGLASVYKRNLDHFNIEMSQEETIEIKTLDTFCTENEISHIHFLKMDVEGHELKVLDGAKEMIKSGKIDFMQFEFGGCNIDSRTYFQDFFYLLKDRYRIYRIIKNGFYEIKQYKEIYECFITTNFFVERIDVLPTLNLPKRD